MDTAKIVYWGDCDDAGYGILSNLRAGFPHIQSLLMDETAWHTWKHLAVPGKKDGAVSLSYLTPSEQYALKAVPSGPWMFGARKNPCCESRTRHCHGVCLSQGQDVLRGIRYSVRSALIRFCNAWSLVRISSKDNGVLGNISSISS
jgi:hypothetical protein